MRVRAAMIVWALVAMVLPAASVPAAEPAAAAQSPAAENVEFAAAPVPAVPVADAALEGRPAGLIYRLDTPSPESRTEALRFDFERRPPPAAAPLRLAPASGGPRSGWAISGRAGPLRWLTPLDGEGESQLRLGGRVADQPRTPGLGLYNMSIHYRFE